MEPFIQQFTLALTELEKKHFTESTLLLTIETLGQSSDFDPLYMIGCATRLGDDITIHQFFSKTPIEEELLLENFLSFSSSFTDILSFNGENYELTFLARRCSLYGLVFHYDLYTRSDFYSICRTLKPLLHLPRLSQTSLEKFFHIPRTAVLDEKDIVSFYHDYGKNPDSGIGQLLLLHNFEDTKNLLSFLPLFAYPELKKEYPAIDTVTSEKGAYRFSETPLFYHNLLIYGHFSFFIPSPVRIHTKEFYIILKENQLCCSLTLQKKVLKHFYSNYKDYVYLLDEEKIIPKVLATSIKKDRIRRAKKEDCFQSAEGYFFRFPSDLENSNVFLFKESVAAKETYIKIDPENLSKDFLSHYCHSILEHFF